LSKYFNLISDCPPCKRKFVDYPFVPEKSIRNYPIEKQRNGSDGSFRLTHLRLQNIIWLDLIVRASVSALDR
jgi:hypothetical protein